MCDNGPAVLVAGQRVAGEHAPGSGAGAPCTSNNNNNNNTVSGGKRVSGGGSPNKRHSHTRRDTEKKTQTNMLWE